MFRNYFKIAIRNLRKHKAYSFINILGLAVGMACSLLILLWVQDELNYDQFNERADRIYRVIQESRDSDSQGRARVGAPWGPAMQADFSGVEAFTRFRYYGRALVRHNGKQFYESNGLYADSAVFQVFTFPFISGDPHTALTTPNAIVLTESFAQKYFGDENPLGKSLTLGSREMQVKGIIKDVPENAHFRFSFLVSFISHNAWYVNEWGMNNYHLYVLLNEGQSPDAITAGIPAFLEKHMGEEVVAQSRSDVRLQPLGDIHLHSNLFREFEQNGDISYVYIFSMIASFILLIACINFMNLSTARATRRSREVGMRKVVGAKRSQLIKQFLGEALLLSLLAMLAAICLVEMLLPYFNTLAAKNLTLKYAENGWLLVGCLGITLFVGLISGAYPAFFLSAFRPVDILKGLASNTRGGGRTPLLRKALVIFQFTITIALLISTGVVFQQLSYMQNKKLGFNQSQVMVLRIQNEAIETHYDAIRDQLQRHPGIENVARSSGLPGYGDWGMPLRYDQDGEQTRFSTRIMVVDHNYVSTLGMTVVNGRDFSLDMAGDNGGFLLNETAAKQLGWENDAVGKTLYRPTERDEATGEWAYSPGPVVGVVEDFHFRSMREQIQPMTFYIDARSYSFIAIRLRPEEISDHIAHVTAVWQQYDNTPFEYFFVDEIFERMYRSEQQLGKLFSAFAFLAIIIACLGLFGLAAFTAEQRFKEIGIRKVLGATITDIVLLLSKSFSKWVLLANLIAWPIAYLVMRRWLEDFAYRSEMTLGIFLAAAGLALTIALATVAYQAIKAAFARPVDTLRYE